MSHRVLIVGVGSIGERHLRCFRATGRAEVSFVEINDELRRSVVERRRLGEWWWHVKADSGAASLRSCPVTATRIPSNTSWPRIPRSPT